VEHSHRPRNLPPYVLPHPDNQSAFVMILNNESQSLAAYEIYEALKQKWYEKADSYEPTLFAVSELAKTTYETTRLKRFLTGTATANRKHYYYPILAFIQRGGERTRKYVMANELPKTRDSIEHWLESIHEHLVLNKPYEEGEEPLYEWFNEEATEKKESEAKASS
jgi:hypothetical protein